MTEENRVMENLIVEVEPFVWVQEIGGKMLDSPSSEMDKRLLEKGYCIKEHLINLPAKKLRVTILHQTKFFKSFGGIGVKYDSEEPAFYPKEAYSSFCRIFLSSWYSIAQIAG